MLGGRSTKRALRNSNNLLLNKSDFINRTPEKICPIEHKPCSMVTQNNYTRKIFCMGRRFNTITVCPVKETKSNGRT